MTQSIRETARAVILRDGKFLFIRRTRQNDEGGIDSWLSIPGGGLEPCETPEHAVVREMKEELGIVIDWKSLLAIQEVPSDESRHYYFLCSIREGKPHLQEQSEEFARMQGRIPNTYAIEWIDETDPHLLSGLFWAYARAYAEFLPFVHTGRSEPLFLKTEP